MRQATKTASGFSVLTLSVQHNRCKETSGTLDSAKILHLSHVFFLHFFNPEGSFRKTLHEHKK